MLFTLIHHIEAQGIERHSDLWWIRVVDGYRPWIRNSARRYNLPVTLWDEFESQMFETIMRVDLGRSKNEIESFMNIKMHGIAISIQRQVHAMARPTSVSQVTITPASCVNEQFDLSFGTAAFTRASDDPYAQVELDSVLNQLPPIASIVAKMRLHGFTWLQISGRLGIPVRTLRAHMSRPEVSNILYSSLTQASA